MNITHERYLREMTGVTDKSIPVSQRVKLKIEQMEERMTRVFGHFVEMQYETLACVVNGLNYIM